MTDINFNSFLTLESLDAIEKKYDPVLKMTRNLSNRIKGRKQKSKNSL